MRVYDLGHIKNFLAAADVAEEESIEIMSRARKAALAFTMHRDGTRFSGGSLEDILGDESLFQQFNKLWEEGELDTGR